jgi:1-deoxy-D-xylulose-5-phosphate reductoisomerase
MQGKIKFVEIIPTVEAIVTHYEKSSIPVLRDLSDVSAIEEDARKATSAHIEKVAS